MEERQTGRSAGRGGGRGGPEAKSPVSYVRSSLIFVKPNSRGANKSSYAAGPKARTPSFVSPFWFPPRRLFLRSFGDLSPVASALSRANDRGQFFRLASRLADGASRLPASPKQKSRCFRPEPRIGKASRLRPETKGPLRSGVEILRYRGETSGADHRVERIRFGDAVILDIVFFQTLII